jgi:hypothetical protein
MLLYSVGGVPEVFIEDGRGVRGRAHLGRPSGVPTIERVALCKTTHTIRNEACEHGVQIWAKGAYTLYIIYLYVDVCILPPVATDRAPHHCHPLACESETPTPHKSTSTRHKAEGPATAYYMFIYIYIELLLIYVYVCVVPTSW